MDITANEAEEIFGNKDDETDDDEDEDEDEDEEIDIDDPYSPLA
jgi:hypothetical protein